MIKLKYVVILKKMDISHTGGLFNYLKLVVFESLLTFTLFDVIIAGDTMQNVKLRVDFFTSLNLPLLRLQNLAHVVLDGNKWK